MTGPWPVTLRLSAFAGQSPKGSTPSALRGTVRTDIEIVREQNKIKPAVPISQVLDDNLLKEVLAELKR